MEFALGISSNRTPWTMRLHALALAASLVLAAPAFAEKVKFAPVYKVGAKTKYEIKLTSSVNGSDILTTSTLESTIDKVEGDTRSFSTKWGNFSAKVDGNPTDVPVEDSKITARDNGELLKVAGGIVGSDAPRMYSLIHFVLPTAEVDENDSYTIDYKAIDAESVPAHKFVGTYLGKTEYKGETAYKFKGVYSEPGNEAFHITFEAVVLATGQVVQSKSSFKNLPLPMMGASLDGDVTLTFKG